MKWNGVNGMEQLGERIKRLRKERKMTLADVAGDRLTKGMLSLIENGKANPSMESLQHIAGQLNVDIADLLQNENSVNYADLLIEVQDYYRQVGEADGKENINAIYTKIIEMIEPHVNNGLLKGQTYEEVRLYENYLLAFFHRDNTYNKNEIYRLVEMYEDARAYRKILNPFSIMAMITFNERQYDQALAYMVEGEAYLKRYSHHIDNVEKLDFYYNMTVLNAAVNKEEKTEYYMNEALNISKKYKIYYRLNDFYRFLFFTHLQKGEWDKCLDYLKKSEAFLVVMEDPIEEIMVFFLQLQACNMIEENFEKTIQMKYNFPPLGNEIVKQSNVFINIEYGYANFQLQQYEKAYEQLKDLYIPKYNNHPIDLANIYRGFALRALCLFELGKVEEAKRDILYALDGVKDFQGTIFKTFILDAQEKIMR